MGRFNNLLKKISKINFAKRQKNNTVEEAILQIDNFEFDSNILDFHREAVFERNRLIEKQKNHILTKEDESNLQELEEYIQSNEAKLCQTKIKSLPITAFAMYNHMTAKDIPIENTIDLSKKSFMYHSSLPYAEAYGQVMDTDLQLYSFLVMTACNNLVDYRGTFTYKNGVISFEPFFLLKGDNTVREIAFTYEKQLTDSDVSFNMKKLYQAPITPRNDVAAFKGVVVNSLRLQNPYDNLSEIENMLQIIFEGNTSESDKDSLFEKLALDLYRKYNGRISFIVQHGDMVVIHGNERTFGEVYTSIPEKYLPDVVKKLDRIEDYSKKTFPKEENIPDK